MKQIFLRSLNISNFQKFRNEEFDFGQITKISGENGAGKTTVYSALTWLLFGKDSKGRDTGKGGFEIKPIEDGNTVHHLNTLVTGFFLIDGKETKLQRLLAENWTKGKDSHYNGDSTEGFVDDVPYKITEFETWISLNLLSEQEFRMITDITYFLSLPTDFKRQYLCEMAGVRDAKDIVQGNESWEKFMHEISGKSMEDILKQVAYERKDLKKQYDDIDPSIRALEDSKPDAQDWNSLEEQKSEISSKINEINSSLSDVNKYSELKQKEIDDLRRKSSALRNDSYNKKNEIQSLQNKLEQEERNKLAQKDSRRNDLINRRSSLERSIKSKKDDLLILKNDLDHYEKRKNALYEEYSKTKASIFESSEQDTICPLLKDHKCDSPALLEFIARNREKAETDFNTNKIEKLDAIMKSGKESVAKTNQIKEEISQIENEITSISNEIKAADTVIHATPIYSNNPIEINSKEIDKLKEELVSLSSQMNDIEKQIEEKFKEGKPDNFELVNKRNDLNKQLESVIRQISIKDQIENIDLQIKKYNAIGKGLAKCITELDMKEMTAKDINRAVVTDATERVNKLFTLVNWQLFELQKNGLYAECCKPTIKGVSTSLNTGSIVNAGIDIVNSISIFKDISAPLFVDNTESVNDPLPALGQSILLLVKKKGTKLNSEIIK